MQAIKNKKDDILISGSLSNLNYTASQSADALFQNFPAVSENNTNNKDNSWKKQMQKNLGFEKLQKSFIKLNVSYEKLK